MNLGDLHIFAAYFGHAAATTTDTGSIRLSAGEHNIEIDYFQLGGLPSRLAGITMDWTTPGNTNSVVIPTDHLTPMQSAQRFYAIEDANYNITALVAPTPSVTFGNVSINTTGFGSGGHVTTAVPDFGQANSVLVQSNGDIIAAGYAGTSVALIRYNTDGSIDTTFGTSGTGIVLTDIYGNSTANQVIADGDNILIVGEGDGSTHATFIAIIP